MDILFLGGVFEENEVLVKSKGNIDIAANTLQWNMIKGLDEINEKPVSLLNSIFIGAFPKHCKELMIQSFEWEHRNGALDNNVGFLNISGIKQFSRAIRLSRAIKKWALKESIEPKVVIAYSAHTPFLYAIKKAKKLNSEIIACLIVPDLPQFMNLRKDAGGLYSFFKYFDCKIIRKLLKNMDAYVLLTKHMSEALEIKKTPYIVMEGMVISCEAEIEAELEAEVEAKAKAETEVGEGTKSEFGPEAEASNTQIETVSEIKSILYTGTLNKRYGIATLLEAFRLIKNENYRLWICGEGEASQDLKEMAAMDKRIEFYGLKPREEVLQLQSCATVLINPRNSEGEYTKYSFPSKNLEYLRSGRPTIGYKLPGIPEEYDESMYFIEQNTAQSMADKLKEVCEKSEEELKEYGKKARTFVLEEKNNVKQAKRIIELIKSVEITKGAT